MQWENDKREKRLADKKQAIVTPEKMFKYTTKKGQECVCIKATNGMSFNGFLDLWNKQGINIEDIKEGDKLVINYIEKNINGSVYNNFFEIKHVTHKPAYDFDTEMVDDCVPPEYVFD